MRKVCGERTVLDLPRAPAEEPAPEKKELRVRFGWGFLPLGADMSGGCEKAELEGLELVLEE
jgi:hypothetical protein